MSTADHAGRPVRPTSAGRGPYADGGNAAGRSSGGGGALRRLADSGSTSSSSAPSRESTRPVPASGGSSGSEGSSGSGSPGSSSSTTAIPKFPDGYTSRTGDDAGVAREQAREAREARRERPTETRPQPQAPTPVQRQAPPNGYEGQEALSRPAPAAAAGAAVTPAPQTQPARRADGHTPAPARPAPARRVRLTVSRIDPWSAMKMSFLLSVALGISLVVMVAVLWTVLEGMGVFDQVNGVIGQVIQDDGQKFDILDFIGFTRVVSLSIVIGVVDVILITALATLGAFLYNVSSALVGGVQLTLTDD
jgi:hypothetical protein